jgi:hypothetical protein
LERRQKFISEILGMRGFAIVQDWRVSSVQFPCSEFSGCRKRLNGEIHGDVVAVANDRVRRKKEIPQLPPEALSSIQRPLKTPFATNYSSYVIQTHASGVLQEADFWNTVAKSLLIDFLFAQLFAQPVRNCQKFQ